MPQANAILAAVEAVFDDEVAFLERLVAIPSLRCAERLAQDLVRAALIERGFEIAEVPIDPALIGDPALVPSRGPAGHPAFSPMVVPCEGMVNLVGRRRPAVGRPADRVGRSLALNAHVDVVPTGPERLWSSPPFVPRRDGDWLYGRGAGDMKAGMAAILFAISALDRAGVALAGELQVHSVVEEESTGNGAAAVIAAGYHTDAVLIPEPTDERLVRANSGVIKFAVTTTGVPAHPREIGVGVSAIDAAVRLITRLRDLAGAWAAERDAHSDFADVANPAALTIGTLSGGEWLASVPGECRFEGRIGFYPGDDARARMAEFEAFVSRVAAEDDVLGRAPPPVVTWVGVTQAGYRLAPGGAAEAMLAEAHVSAWGAGAALGAYVMPAYLDAALYANHAGMPALVYGPIAERIHAPDERVSLASLKRVTATIALFAAGWCG